MTMVTTARPRRRRSARAAKSAPTKKTVKAVRAQAERVSIASTKMLSIRMDMETRELVDRAANVTGQNRTDFMVSALRERATEVLLNQTLFTLSGAHWTAFCECLDNPPLPNAKLRALLAREPAWDS